MKANKIAGKSVVIVAGKMVRLGTEMNPSWSLLTLNIDGIEYYLSMNIDEQEYYIEMT